MRKRPTYNSSYISQFYKKQQPKNVNNYIRGVPELAPRPLTVIISYCALNLLLCGHD